jgi:hypothetical protein
VPLECRITCDCGYIFFTNFKRNFERRPGQQGLVWEDGNKQEEGQFASAKDTQEIIDGIFKERVPAAKGI